MTDEDIARITDTYHAWRGDKNVEEYADEPGFCKSAAIDEVRQHSHVLTPGRYVGAAPQQDEGERFEQKMKRLVEQLKEQQTEATILDAKIRDNLISLGFWKD